MEENNLVLQPGPTTKADRELWSTPPLGPEPPFLFQRHHPQPQKAAGNREGTGQSLQNALDPAADKIFPSKLCFPALFPTTDRPAAHWEGLKE